MVNIYSEFLNMVEEAGILFFSNSSIPGLPCLNTLTVESKWHTGDAETDPWVWKDRAAKEKRLAFGCILGGHKGFVSPALYPLMYAACRPRYSLDERYQEGHLSQTAYRVGKLFEEGAVLSTADIRREMGATKKQGASKVDSAINLLQREYHITVCGNSRKIGKDGQEYGWPANTYCLAGEWAAGWLTTPLPEKKEARERILDHSLEHYPQAHRGALEKALFGKLDK